MKGLRTSKKGLGTHSFYAKKRMVVSVPLDSWVPSNLQMPSWAIPFSYTSQMPLVENFLTSFYITSRACDKLENGCLEREDSLKLFRFSLCNVNISKHTILF